MFSKRLSVDLMVPLGKKSLNTKEKSDSEILKMFKKVELIKELEEELQKLEVEDVNDETKRKLTSGEMKLPPENKRIAHEKKSANENANNNDLSSNIVKKNVIKDSTKLSTNDNIQPNPEITCRINSEESDEKEDKETLPAEVASIKEQAKFLTAEVENNIEEKEESRTEKKKESISLTENENKSQQKRRISFALEDQILEFRKHKPVNQMLPPNAKKLTKDIIKLNDDYKGEQANLKSSKSFTSSSEKELIQDKVEQSKQNFDLVQHILQNSSGEINSLQIKCHHKPKSILKNRAAIRDEIHYEFWQRNKKVMRMIKKQIKKRMQNRKTSA